MPGGGARHFTHRYAISAFPLLLVLIPQQHSACMEGRNMGVFPRLCPSRMPACTILSGILGVLPAFGTWAGRSVDR